MRNFTIIMMLLASSMVQSSDIEREKRMAAEIEDSILDGDVVYLPINNVNSKNYQFFNIYTEAETEKTKGAVIVLHGRGYHPDWEDVANPLRVGLTTNGWATLSMQMPVLKKQAKYYDYVPIFHESFPRIESGINYLKEEGHTSIVIVAHSCSVHMMMAWFESGGFKDIDAFVGVGMGATDYKQPMKTAFPLDRMVIPVLDVYGADEYPAVIREASERLSLIKKAGHNQSRQIIVPGANHYFQNKGDELTAVVDQWLDSLTLD